MGVSRQSLLFEEHQLFASDSMDGDRFGKGVAVNGDTLLIGAYRNDDGAGSYSGAAYVFQRDGATWTEQAKLTASDGAAEDNFGWNVALDGDTALVGASEDDTADFQFEAGSAYVFQRTGTTWAGQQKLTASDYSGYGYFGRYLALIGDTALVGAVGADDGAILGAGAVYVYQRSGTTWSELQKLTASDAITDGGFGNGFAFEGDRAIVGAAGQSDAGYLSGSAYVFERTGGLFVEQQKLTASDAKELDIFGWGIALLGTTAFVSAPYVDDAGTDSGAVYVFEQSGDVWVERQKLIASDAAPNDELGRATAAYGGTLLVGCHRKSSESGSVYVFERSGSEWVERQKLTAANSASFDHFGESVAIHEGTALIGAEDHGIAGTAYVFGLDGYVDSGSSAPMPSPDSGNVAAGGSPPVDSGTAGADAALPDAGGAAEAEDDSGCSCRVPRRKTNRMPWEALLAGVAVCLRRARSRSVFGNCVQNGWISPLASLDHRTRAVGRSAIEQ